VACLSHRRNLILVALFQGRGIRFFDEQSRAEIWNYNFVATAVSGLLLMHLHREGWMRRTPDWIWEPSELLLAQGKKPKKITCWHCPKQGWELLFLFYVRTVHLACRFFISTNSAQYMYRYAPLNDGDTFWEMRL